MQYHHYKALLDLFMLNPSSDSKPLHDLLMFLAQVMFSDTDWIILIKLLDSGGRYDTKLLRLLIPDVQYHILKPKNVDTILFINKNLNAV